MIFLTYDTNNSDHIFNNRKSYKKYRQIVLKLRLVIRIIRFIPLMLTLRFILKRDFDNKKKKIVTLSKETLKD